MGNMALPTEGFLCSGSNPEYRFEATISNDVVSVTMWFNDKKHKFTTTNPLTVVGEIHEYYHRNK